MLSEKLNSVGPERDWQVADLSVKECRLGPKKAWNTLKTANRRVTVGTLHLRSDFPVGTRSLQPSNSMICFGLGPKRPPEAPTTDSHKPKVDHIFGYVAQNAIPRAPTAPASPYILWFPPLKIAETDA